MDSAFEKAAFDLATGEMSKVVEAEGRYYIIRCTSDNDKAKTEVNKSAILEKRKLEACLLRQNLISDFDDIFNTYFGK